MSVYSQVLSGVYSHVYTHMYSPQLVCPEDPPPLCVRRILSGTHTATTVCPEDPLRYTYSHHFVSGGSSQVHIEPPLCARRILSGIYTYSHHFVSGGSSQVHIQPPLCVRRILSGTHTATTLCPEDPLMYTYEGTTRIARGFIEIP